MKKLAKISKASLEMQERGILNFWIHVDYEEGMSQGVGGICLDEWDKERDSRVGTAYGCEMIRLLLIELGVNDFSEMKGKTIWVLGHGEGLRFKPTGIKALNVDNKKAAGVVFSDVAKSFAIQDL